MSKTGLIIKKYICSAIYVVIRPLSFSCYTAISRLLNRDKQLQLHANRVILHPGMNDESCTAAPYSCTEDVLNQNTYRVLKA